ncbi:MAG: AmmeMemoRadiSam system protein A [Spirochaetaceae bacterium]|nr:MAG: AmmeMemoRadiSam system protein A [Spirochaetaceae bacterium]
MEDTTPLEKIADQHRAEILGVAASVIRGAVRGCSDDADLDRFALDEPWASVHLDGAFVSLYAGDVLRSCRGSLESGVPLRKSLVRAAESACHDFRFAPLDPKELDGLTIGVALLYDRVIVDTEPARRAEAVVVGEHGIILSSGTRSGLLLPVVGRRYGWTADEFLDATCKKADLARGAWRYDDVVMETFKAVELEGDFAELTER